MRFGIQKKIATGYILVIVLVFLISTGIYIITNNQMILYNKIAHKYHEAEKATLQLYFAIRKEETAVRRYLQNRDPQFIEAFRNAQQQIAQEKGILEELLFEDDEALRCLQYRVMPVAEYLDDILVGVIGGNETELIPKWGNFPGLAEDFIQVEDQLFSLLNQRHTEAMFIQNKYLTKSYLIKMTMLLLVALLAIALGLLIARSITSPLKKLMCGIEGLKSGTYRHIEEVHSNDELSKLITAFNQMVTTIEQNEFELQNRNEELQAQGEELTAQNEEILAQQKELEEIVGKLMAQEDLLSRLFVFTQSLTRTIQLDQLAETMLDGLMEESKAQAALFMLFDQKTEKLRLIKTSGLDGSINQIAMAVDQGPTERAFREDKPVVIKRSQDQLKTMGFHSAAKMANELYLPLIYNKEILGLIVLGRDREFSVEEQRLLRAMSDQIVVALDNALSHQTVQQALEKVQEMDKLKTELISTVSHELRTPLTSILGFSELLLSKNLLEEKTQKYVQTINKETVRLSKLVNSFLDLQRIENGRTIVKRKTINLHEVINDVVITFQGQSKQHTIETRMAKDLPVLKTDPEQLARVLGNLLSNAIKYSPQGGKVEVEVDRLSSLVTIAVKDYGLGIPQSEQKAIFKPFYRVDNSDRRKIGGTGLGLAIAYQTVQALGGELTVESRYGKGSTFTFALPVLESD